MAVVQISKIQVRRGKKNQGSGLPQLASGELAWAIDSQELFIGNGAVGEGAPAVGNTKILTEHDNILDLLAQYQYKQSSTIQTGVSPNFPVKRTLLSRLDEGAVNGKSFGLVGEGVQTDQTENLQNAIYSLFLESLPYEKVTLELDPGNYRISGTIYIPSNVRLVGSGKDLTVFEFIQGGINYGAALALSGTSNSSGVYPNLPVTSVTGSGSGAIFTVAKTGTGETYTSGNTTVSIIESGTGYKPGDVVKIAGNLIGGSTPANDLIITLSAASGNTVFNTSTVFEFINESSTRQQKNITSTSSTNQPKNIIMENFSVVTNQNNIKIFDFRNVRDSEFNDIKCKGTWTHADGVVANSIAIDLFATSGVVTCQRNKFNDFHVEGFTYAVSSSTDIINNTFNECYFKTLNQGARLGVDSTGFGPRKNSFVNCLFDTISQHGILVEKGYGNKSRGNTFINVGNNSGGFSTNAYSIIKFVSGGNSSSQDNFDRALDLSIDNFNSKYIQEIEGTALREETEANKLFLISTPTLRRAIRLPIGDATGFEINYVFKSTIYNQTRKGKIHLSVDKSNSSVQLVDEYEYLGQAEGEDALVFYANFEEVSGTRSIVVYYTNSNVSDENTFTYTYSVLS